MSKADTRHDDEHIDPLMGGLQRDRAKSAADRDEPLALKWRILIAVIVLAALVEIVRRQAY